MGAAFSVPIEAVLGWLLVVALGVPVRRGSLHAGQDGAGKTRSGTAPVEAALGWFLVTAIGVPMVTAT